jgi:soluble lytic murein transglycosylase
VRATLAALAALAAAFSAVPAHAEGSREYFTARVGQDGAPRQLDAATRDYYAKVFAAIDRQDWAGAPS